MREKIFLFLIVGIFSIGCNSSVKRSETISEVGARKYAAETTEPVELYSWKVAGNWYYALIEPDIAVRSFESITTSENVAGETGDLLTKLKTAYSGRTVLWNLAKIKGFSYPPDETVSEIVQKAADLGITVELVNY